MIYQTRSEMLLSLGSGIRAARLAANLSQEEAARRSGVSRAALRNLAPGRNASTATLVEICRTLRNTDWILLAPAEVSDELFDRPEPTQKRQRARARRVE